MKHARKKLFVRFSHLLPWMRTRISGFQFNTRGNVAIIFAVAALPIITAVGCAIDYSMATMIRTKLQAAADAATLAAVSINSPVNTTAKNMSGDGSVSGGSLQTVNFFNANLTTSAGYSGLTSTATVTKSGRKITSTLAFTAQVPTFFLQVIGDRTLALAGTSTATQTMPAYIDFYLMLDVSGSMGFPSTDGEQTRLAAINPDNYTLYPNGCTFACHFAAQGACANSEQKYNTNGYCLGFTLSRTAGNSSNTPVTSCPSAGTSACIQLRADAVGYAVQQLLQTANTSEEVTNQFRVGLYPFIQHLYSYFSLTTSLAGSASNSSTINYAAAQLATLLDTGNNSSLGSGGTHFENAFPSINTLITSVGDGSSQFNTLPYVFLVTDGAQELANSMERQLGGKQSGDPARYLALHAAQEPWDNDCDPLHSISNRPAPDQLCQRRGLRGQRHHSQYFGRSSGLCLAHLLLHGEYACGHHKCPDQDVRSGRQHCPYFKLAERFNQGECIDFVGAGLVPTRLSADAARRAGTRPAPRDTELVRPLHVN